MECKHSHTLGDFLGGVPWRLFQGLLAYSSAYHLSKEGHV